MFSSLTKGRYDSDVERAFIRAMIDRANNSILANFVGLAILGYACFVVPFGRALAIAVGLRVVAVLVTAFNTKALFAAVEADRPITGLVNRFALGMTFAGFTWGALFWAVPMGQLASLGGMLVLTVILTGVALVVATASPVPRVVMAFLAGFALPMAAWLATVSASLGLGPLFTIMGLAFAIISFSYGLTKEAQKTGRLIVENHRLAEERAALNAELREVVAEKDHLASHDMLTGLLNRRAFEQRAAELGENGGAHGCSVLVIDLDHFKRVNDQAGHAGGDQVLRAAGALLASTAEALPDEAIAARLGGEEFALLVRGLRDAAVHDVALSIGARFRVIPPPEGSDGTISASIGTARWEAAEKFDRCLNRADAALYQAKARGRDRVISAPAQADLPYSPPEMMVAASANGVMPKSGSTSGGK